ncbi:hypothetical protein BH18ACT1_BH18ACT1_19420 [soil metagenome]
MARLRPVLEAFGSVTPVGPLGRGAGAKLVVNSTLGGTLAVLGEALALADGLGLDPAAAVRVLALSPLGQQVGRRRAVLDGEEPPLRFRLRLAGKDLDLVREAAGEAGVELRLAPAVGSWLREAAGAGWGERDYSSVLAYIREAARE